MKLTTYTKVLFSLIYIHIIHLIFIHMAISLFFLFNIRNITEKGKITLTWI